MIYAIDFDNTIAITDYPTIYGENEQGVAFVRRVQNSGHRWILWTCREGRELQEALDWLARRGLYPDAVNDNLPDKKAEMGKNQRKVYADVYVDDHNAGGLFFSMSCSR